VDLPEAEAHLLRAAETRLGITFQQPLLLLQALTHRSFLNEQTGLFTPSNERLEFLGDSALGFLIAHYLYRHFPDASEGELTARRAALIRTSTLARWAHDFDLAGVMRVGAGELAAGPIRDSMLADAFEAVLAAILLDQDLDAVAAFLAPLLEAQAEAIVERVALQNYKGLLQEIVQEQEHVTPTYRTLGVEGPDHNSVFTVEVMIGDRSAGRGSGRSKQTAQQAAAREALRQYLSQPAEHPLQEEDEP
jgi:ribonuclease-3